MRFKDRYAIYCDKVDPKEKIWFYGWYLNIKYKGKTDEEMYTHKKVVSARAIWYKKYCDRVSEENMMTMQWWYTVMSRDGLSEDEMYDYVMMKNKPQALLKKEYQKKCKELDLIPFNHIGFTVYYKKGKTIDWIIQRTIDEPNIYRGEYNKPKKEISMGEKLRLKRIEQWHILT